jgi:urea carboxylase
MIESVLVACRGVSACGIIRSLQRLGLRAVTVHSEADRVARHSLLADRAVCIGNTRAADCYSQADVILDTARICGVEAIHPGDGALSSNPDFAEAVERRGMAFLGPSPTTLRALSEPASLDLTVTAAGKHLVQRVQRGDIEGNSTCVHLDVHFFGDGRGGIVLLGETQRLPWSGGCAIAQSSGSGAQGETIVALRQAIANKARALKYRGVGSFSLLVDEGARVFSVLGVLPGVSAWSALPEVLFGIDLVEWSVLTSAGACIPTLERRALHALAARVMAESPKHASAPAIGIVTGLSLPDADRVDVSIDVGAELSSDSQSHLLTVVATGHTHDGAVGRLAAALRRAVVCGIETNLDELRSACSSATVEGENPNSPGGQSKQSRPSRFEVLHPGTFTIVVDYPGRLGYWPVGVPPSGPMDDLSHRYANRIVGNTRDAACLEMTLSGPTLRFDSDTVVAFVGAAMPALLDEVGVTGNQPIAIHAGQTLRFGTIEDTGARTYLAIRGGVEVASYLNSQTTFALGGFGGHNGRALRQGDSLRIGSSVSDDSPLEPNSTHLVALTNHWTIGVLYGPHAAPEFFTHRDIHTLFESEYEVHFNSNRTGVRLIGPKPGWARTDGGEAGLHPSNIHDVAYAIGAIDFTGDMPILLGPDGPSLGGFVCPATVVSAELWKLGQLRPGDRVRFVPISEAQAVELREQQNRAIERLLGVRVRLQAMKPEGAIIAENNPTETRVSVTYRRSGDKYLLVEYGPMVLDLRLRFRVHALMQWLNARQLPGIIELTPGIRSLQLHFDDAVIARKRLLDELERAESELPNGDALEVPSRIVHLPLSWDDPQTRLAIQKYTQSVRPDAPWCPSNIEFIRRINGLASERDVYNIVFGASYLVLGLGDVYLGAPVATPVDPRHRLVTTKYNPARTWTPENAVGIGGAYLCIYGMEGPGGYQFVGRTIQVYNRYRRTRRFTEQQPWLLRFFDQLRFYPVSPEQLLDHRRDFVTGKFDIAIEETRFKLADYQSFLMDNDAAIRQFKLQQQAAFDAERQRWLESGQLSTTPQPKKAITSREPNPGARSFECTQ